MAPDLAAIRERMRWLAAELQRHNDLYYNRGTPEISDADYDRMMRELRELERAHPALKAAGSPSEQVGAPVVAGRGFAQVEHRAPMLSLESLTSAEEVREFDERIRKGLSIEEDRIEYSLEPKYDGVSASLLYEGGRLVRGITRGDGRIGEEITRNLRQVRGVPERLRGAGRVVPELVEVRGEVILRRARFAELRAAQEEAGETPFRNPRNAVAGALKRSDPRGLDELGMEFIFWGVGDLRGVTDAGDYLSLCERIAMLGFAVSSYLERGVGVASVVRFHDDLEARRDEVEYEIDGIVAKVNDFAAQRILGRTARAPRWAFAHKFAPRRGWTQVLDIRVQVGRTGALTPVAILAPIELAGVTVQRATLHNFDLLRQRDVRIGDRVEIERAGDVIPEVVRVDEKHRKRGSHAFPLPDRCPVCEEPAHKEGAYLYCSNIDCPAQIRERIIHLAGRRALNIDRLGEKYVDQLREAGLLERVEDVFFLPEHEERILALERWGEQSFRNLRAEIDRAKSPTLPRFLYALGIPQVGEKVAADLAEAFPDLAALAQATVEQLLEVEGVGPKVADEVVTFFASPANQRFLAALARAGVQVVARPPRPQSGEAPLGGRTFCFTGGLESMTRDQARERVESLGAESAASISKRVTDVIAGTGAGSKLDRARKLGINILTEEEFLALLTDAGSAS